MVTPRFNIQLKQKIAILYTKAGSIKDLDSFEIQNGDLVLDFPSRLVKPRRDMTPG